MKLMRNSRYLAVAAMLAASAQTFNPEFTNAQREEFLRKASVVSRKNLSMGITNSVRTEMKDGDILHSAHLQTVDVAKSRFEGVTGTELNFRDSYKFNIAAYELTKLLDLNMVPPSVERKIGGERGAVTWWVDNVHMTELDRWKNKVQAPDQDSWNRQMHVVRAFDELIYNTDRNLGNLVITKDWQIWMIDHTRAFRMHKSCAKLNTLRQIDRKLLARMRTLNREAVQEKLGSWLSKPEMEGLLARCSQIVKHFDREIASRGEGAVLFDVGR